MTYIRSIQIDEADIAKIKITKHDDFSEIETVEHIRETYLLDEQNAWEVVKQVWRNDSSLLERNDRK